MLRAAFPAESLGLAGAGLHAGLADVADPEAERRIAGDAVAGLVSGSGRCADADHVDPIGASADSQAPEIANRKRRRRAETLHRRARGEKAAIDVAAEFLKPCCGIHDVAVENDSALDVADLADNHRPEIQAAANPRAP